MNLELIYPMAAMVLLTFIVLMALFRSRVAAVKSGKVNAGFYKTYQEGSEPRQIAQFSRHLVNMFESPTLFYAACVVGIVTGQNATVLIVLAWIYVALRALHAYIHTGKNSISPRMWAYFSSWLVLLGRWGMLVAGVA
jgi:hypothetical protein